MAKKENIIRELQAVFEVRQAEVIAKVVTDAYDDLVKTSDFNELKAIVKDLAQAQNRTEQRVEELAEGQKALQEGQRELQHTTAELQREMAILAKRMGETNSTLGGLGQSVAYALENEAYRMLPAFLAEKYDIVLDERLVRTEIEGEEINIFGRGKQHDTDIVVVGETKLRLDERRRIKPGRKTIFEQLEAKADAVQATYPGLEIVLIIITHYARLGAIKLAEEGGIIVVQSFEW